MPDPQIALCEFGSPLVHTHQSDPNSGGPRASVASWYPPSDQQRPQQYDAAMQQQLQAWAMQPSGFQAAMQMHSPGGPWPQAALQQMAAAAFAQMQSPALLPQYNAQQQSLQALPFTVPLQQAGSMPPAAPQPVP
ncbi:TPA: hypothetical protein ACH3X2_000293 [Trebouxia sp. C0005]